MNKRRKIKQFLSSINALLPLLLILCTENISAQYNPETDTIAISEVVISPRFPATSRNGFKSYKIDSSLINHFATGSLSDLISGSTSLFIKSYGGALSSPSFRGTGASHTIVSWNGININSPMTGQSDFSAIPLSNVNEIEIYYGAASMSKFSGAFGGTVNLVNRPLYNNGVRATISSAIGSYGKRDLKGMVTTGNSNFQSQTAISLNSANNDFLFKNEFIGTETVYQKRINNQTAGHDISQDLWYRSGNLEYSAHAWYSYRNRNLPGTMLTATEELNETQRDKSFRGLVLVRSTNSPVKFSIGSSFNGYDLLYINRIAAIRSLNNSFTWQAFGEITANIASLASLTLAAKEELSRVKSINYNDITSESVTSMSVTLESHADMNPGFMLMVREQIHNNDFLIPDVAAGAEYTLFNGKGHSIHANVARNSRIPSMNDLYWNPGGNTSLENESAWLYETGYEYNFKPSGKSDINFSVNYFLTRTKNLIQWLPGQYSYWTPQNINSTEAQGVEASLKGNFDNNIFKIAYNVGYSYTNARNKSDPSSEMWLRQLIYIPKHTAFSIFTVERKNLGLTLMNDFTGRRYITPENSKSLNAINLISIGADYLISAGNNLVELGVKVNNLLNTDYQSVAYYPEAGRSFLIHLEYTFNNYK